MRTVRIYVLFIDNRFADVFASYSEAQRELNLRAKGASWIQQYDREDY